MAAAKEHSFRNLAPDQAAALAQLLDLEAGWEILLQAAPPDPEGRAALQDLRGKQKAYEAFREKQAAYNARYSPGHVPQVHLSSPAQLGAWCRVTRDLCLIMERTAQGRCPVHVLGKAYRCAERIGARTGQGVIGRSPRADTIGAVIQELDALVRWCDSLSIPPGSVAS